jgi:hypothetical protein
MKRFVFLMGMFLAITAVGFAQGNGGQLNQNNYLKLVYKGKVNGVPQMDIINKQNCSVVADVDYGGVARPSITLAPNATYTYALTDGFVPFKVKATDRCDPLISGDNGWVEYKNIVDLPVKFREIRIRRVPPKY